jgi:hypothetical protein
VRSAVLAATGAREGGGRVPARASGHRPPLLELAQPAALGTAHECIRPFPHWLAADDAGPFRKRMRCPVLGTPLGVQVLDVGGVLGPPIPHRIGVTATAPAIEAACVVRVGPKSIGREPLPAPTAPLAVQLLSPRFSRAFNSPDTGEGSLRLSDRRPSPPPVVASEREW